MIVEAHLGRVELANNHCERAYDRVAGRVEIGDAEVGANAKRQDEASEDDEKDGKEFGRVGERASKSDHVEAEDLELLNVERKSDESAQHSH